MLIVIFTPCFILNFKVFANVFKWIYRKFHYWMERRKSKQNGDPNNFEFEFIMNEKEEVLVPTTACLLVLLGYISIGKIYEKIFIISDLFHLISKVQLYLHNLKAGTILIPPISVWHHYLRYQNLNPASSLQRHLNLKWWQLFHILHF